MNYILKFLRNKEIFNNKDEAIFELSKKNFNEGQPIIALYEEDSVIKSLFAIGTEDGIGKCTIYSNKEDVDLITKWVNDLVNGENIQLNVTNGSLSLGSHLSVSGETTLNKLSVSGETTLENLIILNGIKLIDGGSKDKVFATDGSIVTLNNDFIVHNHEIHEINNLIDSLENKANLSGSDLQDFNVNKLFANEGIFNGNVISKQDIIAYSPINNFLLNNNISEGGLNLWELNDANIINSKKGDIIIYDGSEWVNQNIISIDCGDYIG